MRAEGRFEELVVAAVPRVIGYLRPELAPSVKSTIVRTLNQDLAAASPEQLYQILFSTDAVIAAA